MVPRPPHRLRGPPLRAAPRLPVCPRPRPPSTCAVTCCASLIICCVSQRLCHFCALTCHRTPLSTVFPCCDWTGKVGLIFPPFSSREKWLAWSQAARRPSVHLPCGRVHRWLNPLPEAEPVRVSESTPSGIRIHDEPSEKPTKHGRHIHK